MKLLNGAKKKNIVDLLYKNLSYVIQGIAFEVRKDFGLVFVSLWLVLIGGLLFNGLGAKAAQLNFISQAQEISVNSQFQVDLVLNTENEAINAVAGKIVFLEDLLELKEIRDGNSIINFWIERPSLNSSAGGGSAFGGKSSILYSGIIPGGYLGNQGIILSAIFQAKKAGRLIIEINDAKVLLNDGKGTAAELKIKNLELIAQGDDIRNVSWTSPLDTNPPEEFKPALAQNPDLFNGQWFLVFATQDKGSGIDHYEVREGFWSRFIIAESPYLLKHQKLDKKIKVKAIDKAGNERIVTLVPVNPPWGLIKYWKLAIILIAILIIILIWLNYKRVKCLKQKS